MAQIPEDVLEQAKTFHGALDNVEAQLARRHNLPLSEEHIEVRPSALSLW